MHSHAISLIFTRVNTYVKGITVLYKTFKFAIFQSKWAKGEHDIHCYDETVCSSPDRFAHQPFHPLNADDCSGRNGRRGARHSDCASHYVCGLVDRSATGARAVGGAREASAFRPTRAVRSRSRIPTCSRRKRWTSCSRTCAFTWCASRLTRCSCGSRCAAFASTRQRTQCFSTTWITSHTSSKTYRPVRSAPSEASASAAHWPHTSLTRPT